MADKGIGRALQSRRSSCGWTDFGWIKLERELLTAENRPKVVDTAETLRVIA